MRISDWSSDVCSSDLIHQRIPFVIPSRPIFWAWRPCAGFPCGADRGRLCRIVVREEFHDYRNHPASVRLGLPCRRGERDCRGRHVFRSEEHTSELQSLMRISYAVFCLQKKKKQNKNTAL